MTDSEILEAVKERKSITGNFQDGALSGYIADAIEILIDAGVSESIIRSTASLGCLTSCVTDMWDNVGGGADFSPLTHKRIAQLVCKSILSESPSKPEANELIEHYSSHYTVTKQDETQIPINIPEYSTGEDILNVYINGFKLIEGIEYANDAEYITLANPVDIGTVVEINVINGDMNE